LPPEALLSVLLASVKQKLRRIHASVQAPWILPLHEPTNWVDPMCRT
jgi:hypothetical protein